MTIKKHLVLCSLSLLICQPVCLPVFAEDELEIIAKPSQTSSDNAVSDVEGASNTKSDSTGDVVNTNIDNTENSVKNSPEITPDNNTIEHNTIDKITATDDADSSHETIPPSDESDTSNKDDSITITEPNDATINSDIEDKEQVTNNVKLSVLNKISGRSSDLKVSKSKSEIFGTLEISMLKCWHSPPDEPSESKALLVVWEKTPDEPKKLIFNGWMFSSTISVSSLEHPIYDVIVEECM